MPRGQGKYFDQVRRTLQAPLVIGDVTVADRDREASEEFDHELVVTHIPIVIDPSARVSRACTGTLYSQRLALIPLGFVHVCQSSPSGSGRCIEDKHRVFRSARVDSAAVSAPYCLIDRAANLSLSSLWLGANIARLTSVSANSESVMPQGQHELSASDATLREHSVFVSCTYSKRALLFVGHAADLLSASSIAANSSRPTSACRLGDAMVSMIDQSGLITMMPLTNSMNREAASVIGST